MLITVADALTYARDVTNLTSTLSSRAAELRRISGNIQNNIDELQEKINQARAQADSVSHCRLFMGITCRRVMTSAAD